MIMNRAKQSDPSVHHFLFSSAKIVERIAGRYRDRARLRLTAWR
jgi:hypothetical protein